MNCSKIVIICSLVILLCIIINECMNILFKYQIMTVFSKERFDGGGGHRGTIGGVHSGGHGVLLS